MDDRNRAWIAPLLEGAAEAGDEPDDEAGDDADGEHEQERGVGQGGQCREGCVGHGGFLSRS